VQNIPALGHYHSFPTGFGIPKQQTSCTLLATKAKNELDNIRQHHINKQEKHCGDGDHYKHSQCGSAGLAA
jgi:hypothetical protein